MNSDVFPILIGILLAVSGAIIWSNQEQKKQLMSSYVFISIVMILIGAIGILMGLEKLLHMFSLDGKVIKGNVTWKEWAFIIGCIFIGSVSYSVAAYYHLKLENWSFFKAFAIALPLILIEYQFSIRGNFNAKHILELNAMQITLITMTFYFVNSWIINYFFLKAKVVWWREVLAFAFIIAAFMLTTTQRGVH